MTHQINSVSTFVIGVPRCLSRSIWAGSALFCALVAMGCGEPPRKPVETPSLPDDDRVPKAEPKHEADATAPDAGALGKLDEGKLLEALVAAKLRPRASATGQLEHCLEEQRRRRENQVLVEDGRPPRIRTESAQVGGPPWRALPVGDRLCVGLPNQHGVSPHWDFALYIGALTRKFWQEPLLECARDALEADPEAEGRFELRVVGDADGAPIKIWAQRNEGVPDPIVDCWVEVVREGGRLPQPTYMPFVSGVVPVVLLPSGGGE